MHGERKFGQEENDSVPPMVLHHLSASVCGVGDHLKKRRHLPVVTQFEFF